MTGGRDRDVRPDAAARRDDRVPGRLQDPVRRGHQWRHARRSSRLRSLPVPRRPRRRQRSPPHASEREGSTHDVPPDRLRPGCSLPCSSSSVPLDAAAPAPVRRPRSARPCRLPPPPRPPPPADGHPGADDDARAAGTVTRRATGRDAGGRRRRSRGRVARVVHLGRRRLGQPVAPRGADQGGVRRAVDPHPRRRRAGHGLGRKAGPGRDRPMASARSRSVPARPRRSPSRPQGRARGRSRSS